jgi:hypothetical protein
VMGGASPRRALLSFEISIRLELRDCSEFCREYLLGCACIHPGGSGLSALFLTQIQSHPMPYNPVGNGYEPDGREFESLRAHHSYPAPVSPTFRKKRERWGTRRLLANPIANSQSSYAADLRCSLRNVTVVCAAGRSETVSRCARREMWAIRPANSTRD